jgi:FkbM family methyltransferase
MNLLTSISQPKAEYLFRPSQIIQRLSCQWAKDVPEYLEVKLPSGLPIRINPRESIGSCIWRVGIFELHVSEAIYRLLEPGEWAVDVGANIGHMSAIMAQRVGTSGKVLAFEPQPRVLQELHYNVALWAKNPNLATILVYPVALSDSSREGLLGLPAELNKNGGLASVVTAETDKTKFADSVSITLEKFDAVVPANKPIGLLKIDVEGHELAVLNGATEHVRNGFIRDIVFEEYKTYPNATTDFLESNGYTVYYLSAKLFGLAIGSVKENYNFPYYTAPTYLATRDPARLTKRLSKKGWAILRTRYKK